MVGGSNKKLAGAGVFGAADPGRAPGWLEAPWLAGAIEGDAGERDHRRARPCHDTYTLVRAVRIGSGPF